MLNTDCEEILFDENGKVTGIKSGGKTAKAPLVICDPSYAPNDKLKPTGKVIRATCFMDHPIPETNDAASVQIIIPAKQTGRSNGKSIFNLSTNSIII